jgi:hypothetical protein
MLLERENAYIIDNPPATLVIHSILSIDSSIKIRKELGRIILAMS